MRAEEFEKKARELACFGNTAALAELSLTQVGELVKEYMPERMSTLSMPVYAAVFKILANVTYNVLDDDVAKDLADDMAKLISSTVIKTKIGEETFYRGEAGN